MGNVPELRFPEFSGEWEEVKLGDITTFFDSRRIPLKESERVAGEYPYYGASGIIDYVNDYIFDGEYILLGEDGANIIMRNSRLVFLAKGKFWVNNHAHIFQTNGSNYFLCEALERINFLKYNTGTAQPKLNADIVKKIKIYLPPLPEQQKIADFLTAIDEKITILTDKITQLKTYKRGMMQKLLSGELRFPGFKDAWREVRLGETGTIITGSTPPTKDSENYGDDYLWVTPTDIRETKIVYSTNKKLSMVGAEKARMIPKNSLLVTCIASIGKNVILKEKGSCNQQINAITPNGNFDVDFLYYIIENNVNKLLAYAGGGSMLILNKKDFSSIKFEFPPFPEQQKIADFLTAIDDKLTIEQEKLDQLKLYKQGLLQKMFI